MAAVRSFSRENMSMVRGTERASEARSGVVSPQRTRTSPPPLLAAHIAESAARGPGAMESQFQRLCLDTLVAGGVQSFVDLVYLACDSASSLELLPRIRDHLVATETARRRGDTATVITNYGALADVYEGAGGGRLRCYFLERSLDIARMTGDTAAEMAALHRLGNAYEQLGDSHRAVGFHTDHHGVATRAGDTAQAATAAAQLVRVYTKQAAEAESHHEMELALELHVAAVEAAELSGDYHAQAETSFAAGRACIELGRPAQAVPYLQSNVRVWSGCCRGAGCVCACAVGRLALPLTCDPAPSHTSPPSQLRLTLEHAELEGGGREPRAYLALTGAHIACDNLDAAMECLVRGRSVCAQTRVRVRTRR